MVDVVVKVNGVERSLRLEPRYLLADVLRDDLALTGLHLGCEGGVCGACLVLIDGEPAASCLTLAVELDGRAVETVEHLTTDASGISALARAFVECGAVQCGFCTSGFLVMGQYLIETGSALDEESVRRSLNGSLCRCTGYESIIDAIVATARRRVDD